jgi:hypothetical protein
MNGWHSVWLELNTDTEMVVASTLADSDMHVMVLAFLEINPLGELYSKVARAFVSQFRVVVPEPRVASSIQKPLMSGAGWVHGVCVFVEPKRTIVIAAHQEAVSAGHWGSEIALKCFY